MTKQEKELTNSILQGKFHTVSISEVAPDPKQPRQDFNEQDLEKLTGSIKERGILTPIVVEPKVKGKYHIIDGERRYRCAINLGIKEVPVNVLDRPLEQHEKNIIRFHLQEMHAQWTIFEKAEALYALKQSLGLDETKLAKTLGLTLRTTSEYLSILTFSVKIRKLAVSERLPFNYLRQLVYINNALPTKIKQQFPDYLERFVTKYKKGFIKNARDISVIHQLIKGGELALVSRFLKEDQYTAHNALHDSDYVNERQVESVMNRSRMLLRDIRVIKKNNLNLDEMAEATLESLKVALNDLV